MMKRAIYLIVLIPFLLIGCANNQDEQQVTTEVNSISTNETPSYYQGYLDNPQVTNDQSLQEVGTTIRDVKGEVTLNDINKESQTVKIGAIELTIREAKALHFKPDYGLIDFFHSYTHDQEFDFVKVFVEIKNTSNQNLKFAPISLVHTSAGEQKTWEDDIYLEELNGEIPANETKKGNLGFIIEKSKIDSFEITTSDVFNEQDKTLDDAEKLKIKF
ncbi:DUF4352 domain-containing protein [Psychrobacillus sp. BM2]|uniref:DUF4352 domain-containing protein n=1 Tax=Psychrobacillus sp. BM2 TaxID=3400421 RepID=UPI003B023753